MQKLTTYLWPKKLIHEDVDDDVWDEDEERSWSAPDNDLVSHHTHGAEDRKIIKDDVSGEPENSSDRSSPIKGARWDLETEEASNL